MKSNINSLVKRKNNPAEDEQLFINVFIARRGKSDFSQPAEIEKSREDVSRSVLHIQQGKQCGVVATICSSEKPKAWLLEFAHLKLL